PPGPSRFAYPALFRSRGPGAPWRLVQAVQFPRPRVRPCREHLDPDGPDPERVGQAADEVVARRLGALAALRPERHLERADERPDLPRPAKPEQRDAVALRVRRLLGAREARVIAERHLPRRPSSDDAAAPEVGDRGPIV